MKWLRVLENILLLFQQFGRSRFCPTLHFISNRTTLISNNFSCTQLDLHQISVSTVPCFEDCDFKIYNEILVLDNLLVLTLVEFLKNVTSKLSQRPLILILWEDSEVKLNPILKLFQKKRKKALDLFVLTMNKDSYKFSEANFEGHEVILKNWKTNKFLTRHRMDFYGDQLVGNHIDYINFESRRGDETLMKFGHFKGFDHQVVAYVQDYLNFSLKVIGPADTTGVSQKCLEGIHIKPDWIWIAEQVDAGVSDFGINSIPVIPRLRAMSRYLTPQSFVRRATLIYVMKKEIQLNPYGNVFSTKSWICITVVIFLGFLTRGITTSKNRVDTFVWIVAIVTQQSWEEHTTQRTSQRIVTLTMATLCLILNTMFCSGLISSLSVGTSVEYTIPDLVQLQYKFGLANNSYLITNNQEARVTGTGAMDVQIYDVFEGVKNTPVFRNLDPNFSFPAMDDGIRRVLTTPRYGIIGVTLTNCLEAASTSDLRPFWPPARICEELKSMSILDYGVRFANIFKTDSPYLEYFKIARMTMKERGIDSLLRNRNTRADKVFRTSCNPKKGLVSFTIEDVVKPFSILFCGMLVSFLMLAVELFLLSNIKKSFQVKICKTQ